MVSKEHFTPKTILRDNVNALMAKAKKDGDEELSSQAGLGRKARVTQSTIGRIISKHGENARVETVARIAEAFGLEGWQLMVAGMNPANPPVLQPVSKAEQELYKRFKELSKDLGTLK